MEELKELVNLLNSMPTLALWVAVGFWAYKVIVVGSIYGLIRFMVDRAHSAFVSRRMAPKVRELVWHKDVDAYMSEECFESVMRLLRRFETEVEPHSKIRFFNDGDYAHLEKAVNQYLEGIHR